MNANTFLNQYQLLYRKVQRLAKEIQELEVRATAGSGAIRYDKDRVVSSPTADTMRLIERKVDREKLLDSTAKELRQLKDSIDKIFKRLTPFDRQVARLTWLDFEGPVYISQRLRVSKSTVVRRKAAIIVFVQQELDAGVLDMTPLAL